MVDRMREMTWLDWLFGHRSMMNSIAATKNHSGHGLGLEATLLSTSHSCIRSLYIGKYLFGSNHGSAILRMKKCIRSIVTCVEIMRKRSLDIGHFRNLRSIAGVWICLSLSTAGITNPFYVRWSLEMTTYTKKADHWWIHDFPWWPARWNVEGGNVPYLLYSIYYHYHINVTF